MAKFYVDTEWIDQLSKVIKYLSDYADDAQKIPREAREKLVFQFGSNIDLLKDRLRAAHKELRTIHNDLDYLSQGLSVVVSETSDADAIVWALFSDMPKMVLTGEKLITTNLTADHLSNRNQTLDGIKLGLSNGLMDSLVAGFKDLTYEDYNTAEMKENLIQLIARMMNGQKNATDVIDDTYEIVDYFLEGGQTTLELLEKCPQLKDLLEAYSKGAEWGGYAVDAVELLVENIAHHLSDYTQNIQKLENIRKALISVGYDADLVHNAINSLINDYTNKVAYSIGTLSDAGVELTFNVGTDVLTLGGFNAVDYFADLLKEVSGMKDEADHIKNIYLTNAYSGALVAAYEQCAERIRNGTYTEDDMKNCQMYYEMAIYAKLHEYESICAITEDPSEKERVEKEIERLNKLL